MRKTALFPSSTSIQYPVSAITFVATNETATRVSPVPLSPNPISHVLRCGRAPPEAEDRQSPREFRPARQTPSLPFHWRKQFSSFDRRALYECEAPFMLPFTSGTQCW